jgi:hypothetical protein
MYRFEIAKTAEIFEDKLSENTFNPKIYPVGAYALFTSQMTMPDNPYIIGIFGSAWEKESNTNSSIVKYSSETISSIERMADALIELNNIHGNIVICDGACPPDAFPSVITQIIKEKSRKNGNKEIYSIGIHPATEKEVLGEDALYSSKDMVIFTNYLDTWNGDYDDAFRDRDSRNCDWSDAGIIVHGGIGSSDEAAGLSQKRKIIAVYEGTGGVADSFPLYLDELYNKHKVLLIKDSDPSRLVKKVFGQIHYDRARERNSIISVADIRPDHAHIWEPIYLKDNDHPEYRHFPFEIHKPNTERTILEIGLDELIENSDLRPDSLGLHNGEHNFIRHCTTFQDVETIDKKVGELRGDKEIYVVHLAA